MPLPDGCQKTYYDEGIPIVKADFYYCFPNREILGIGCNSI
jgi:hypothetical protein